MAVSFHVSASSGIHQSPLDPATPGSKTIEVAKSAFEHLSRALNLLPNSLKLPDSNGYIEPVENQLEPVDPQDRSAALALTDKELDRIEKPDSNAIIRLCYLATFSQDNQVEKVPFTKQDLDAFILSKTTRDNTYRWFKLGMVPFTLLSGIQGFASLMIPNTLWAQGLLVTTCGVAIAAAGILYTGYNPDHSQDCLNEKVDKLNRVKKELDEVARTLISFYFNGSALTRALASQAAHDINIDWIEQAATTPKYAISKQDIAPSLELINQAIDYIRTGRVPNNNDLNNFLRTCLNRKKELLISEKWEFSS